MTAYFENGVQVSREARAGTRAGSSRSHFVHAKCPHAGRKRVRKQEGGERVQRAPKATARIKVWGHRASLYASRYCFTIASLNRLAANGLSLGSWCPSPRILLPKRTISWLATCRWLLWCQLASPKTLATQGWRHRRQRTGMAASGGRHRHGCGSCSKQVERRTSCGQGAEMQFHALRGVSALETRLMTSREPNGLWLLYRTRSRADINVPSLGYLRTESC